MTEELLWDGTFEEKPFPALLAEIKDSEKTGVLLAKDGDVEKRIFFQNGEPIASRSNVRKDLLGEILCARGKISAAQLDEAISESIKNTGDNFGQILVKKEFLTPKDLYSECKYQFICVLFSLFPWESGTYSVQGQEASSLIPPDLPRFHVKFTKLVSEGIRLIKDEQFIDRAIGDIGRVVRPASVPIPSQDLSYQGEDKAVLEALGRGKPLKDVIESMSLEPFLVKKIVYTLSCLKAIEVQAPADIEAEAAVVMEAEEELPALSESSLSAFMSDIMPDEKAESLPNFEEEFPAAPGIGEISDQMGEEGEFIAQEMTLESEEAFAEVPEKIQFGLEEETVNSAAKDDGGIAAAYPEEDLGKPFPEEPAEEETPFPLEQEEVLSEIIGEEEEAGMAPAESPVEEAEEEQKPWAAEDIPAGEQVEEAKEEKEEALPLVQEEAAAGLPGKGAQEKKVRRKGIKKKKKGFPLVPVFVSTVILLLLGALAVFYYPKLTEEKAVSAGEGEKTETVSPDAVIRDTGEALQEVAKQEAAETAPKELPPESEEEAPESRVAGPETAEPVEEDLAATVKEPAPGDSAAPIEEKVVSEKEEKAALPEPAPSWEDVYAEGLKNFQEGNLNSAFTKWSDVIRYAPDQAYSIQIEISSYLNFASKDIKEALRGEKVFIIPMNIENKSLYRVLCGVYGDRLKAKDAMDNLTPYLKAQNPALVSIDRLKKNLAD